ncbi:hypothetical protein SAY87_016431 [Trapa incisa]|uniref:Uncharacterized protein n=1 Tax=Trapa incisa TaxID=236973 RepID=A0AAN7LFF8_9MYRT|nr:hypothetical protein SAY87_016431 [Trapa incisa]
MFIRAFYGITWFNRILFNSDALFHYSSSGKNSFPAKFAYLCAVFILEVSTFWGTEVCSIRTPLILRRSHVSLIITGGCSFFPFKLGVDLLCTFNKRSFA